MMIPFAALATALLLSLAPATPAHPHVVTANPLWSIVVHELPTSPAGVAGPRSACVGVPF
jgi:hypothetical protein